MSETRQRVEALAGEDADRGVEDRAALVGGRCLGQVMRGPRRLGPAVGVGPAVGERGQRGRGSRPAARGRGRRRRSPRRRRPARAPRPTGRRSPSARRSRSAAAPCRTGSAASTNAWFSIARARSRTSQWSRPVAAVNADGTVSSAGAAHGEDPVELGEAEVVADAEPEPRAPPSVGDDELVARLLVLGLAVG